MPLSEKAKQNKIRYNHQYTKEHYKRISLIVSPEQYERTKAAAISVHESTNSFIKRAIDERIEHLDGNDDNSHPQS